MRSEKIQKYYRIEALYFSTDEDFLDFNSYDREVADAWWDMSVEETETIRQATKKPLIEISDEELNKRAVEVWSADDWCEQNEFLRMLWSNLFDFSKFDHLEKRSPYIVQNKEKIARIMSEVLVSAQGKDETVVLSFQRLMNELLPNSDGMV